MQWGKESNYICVAELIANPYKEKSELESLPHTIHKNPDELKI